VMACQIHQVASGRKFETTAMVEFFNGANQSHVAFLDESRAVVSHAQCIFSTDTTKRKFADVRYSRACRPLLIITSSCTARSRLGD
jgi:hypothetical protein